MKFAKTFLSLAAVLFLGGCVGPFISQADKDALATVMLANPPPGAGRYWRECVRAYQDRQPCTEDLRIDREAASMGKAEAERRAFERMAETQRIKRANDQATVAAAAAAVTQSIANRNAAAAQNAGNRGTQTAPAVSSPTPGTAIAAQQPSVQKGASNVSNVAACLTLENRPSAISTQSLVNTCNYSIEATWCFEGGSPSDSCSRGFRNLWTIRAGATYPLQSKTITQLKVGACRGPNTLKTTGPLTYDCAER